MTDIPCINHHIGYPSVVGFVAKHQNLARQVVVFIEDPPQLNDIFQVHQCSRRAQPSSWAPRSASPLVGGDLLNEFVNNFNEILLPNLAREIEEESVFYATSTLATPGLLDPVRPEEQLCRLLFGLCNATAVYQEAMLLESLSLEEDLIIY